MYVSEAFFLSVVHFFAFPTSSYYLIGDKKIQALIIIVIVQSR